MKPPIVLFVYSRPDHVNRTVESLLCNYGVKEYDLIVYSDAARSPDKEPAVEAVRQYLNSIKGFRSITINHRIINYGLAKSISEGVTEVLSRYESVIVLEDDIVTSPFFLTYMSEALGLYKEDDRIISVHGYVYPVQESLPDAFFLRGADCWGWGTWRRGWALYNPNGKLLLGKLIENNLMECFDFNGSYSYSKMLKAQIDGQNDSWAILWHASAFLANKLTLYPGVSLVSNIGNDNSGTHCEATDSHNVILSKSPIDFSKLVVRECEMSRKAFENFFRKNKGGFVKRLNDLIRRNLVKLIKGYL